MPSQDIRRGFCSDDRDDGERYRGIHVRAGTRHTKHAIIESDNAKIIAMGAGLKMLVIIADPVIKLDSTVSKMTDAADKIKKAAGVI